MKCLIAGTCIISGTQIGCSVTFLGKDISATLKLHPCKSQPTASITLSAFGFHYSHTFSSEEDVPITGLYYGPIAKVYLKLSLKKNSFGEIHVKVSSLGCFENKINTVKLCKFCNK